MLHPVNREPASSISLQPEGSIGTAPTVLVEAPEPPGQLIPEKQQSLLMSRHEPSQRLGRRIGYPDTGTYRFGRLFGARRHNGRWRAHLCRRFDVLFPCRPSTTGGLPLSRPFPVDCLEASREFSFNSA